MNEDTLDTGQCSEKYTGRSFSVTLQPFCVFHREEPSFCFLHLSFYVISGLYKYKAGDDKCFLISYVLSIGKSLYK